MDYGFKDRVDKVFASISSSSSWSLTDAPVQRREWNRDQTHDDDDDDDDDQIPLSSSFQTGDDDDIRSSIGLDSTLDHEEEEDAYDKMAEGRENCSDRLYMKDVTDHGPYLNSHNVLPGTLCDVKKDPRANHDAAKTRLKEDDDEAAVRGSDEHMLNAEASEQGVIRIKSILKRKSYDEVGKPVKRVRFDSTCKNVDAPRPEGAFDLTRVSENGRGVPDYVLNPSKYTRYTFDDCSHDGCTNVEAYLELLEQIKESPKHGVVEQTSCGELPKSVVFIPRKKGGEEQVKQSSTQACSTIGIAAVEVQQGEISEMQEDDESRVDDVCTKVTRQKPVRQYRSKIEEHDDVS